jgi:hypothetical protein
MACFFYSRPKCSLTESKVMTDILLIQPPALKAAEPPLSLAVLLAHLKEEGFATTAIDANLEAYLYLLDGQRLATKAGVDNDTNLRRALKHRASSLQILRSPAAKNFARYNTAVRYLNRLLALWNNSDVNEQLTLGDYHYASLSPFSPEDLKQVATGAVRTLFHDYFSTQLMPQIMAENPRIIAISVNYLHQAIPAFALAGLLRKALPQAQLIVGGGLITSWQKPLTKLQLQLYPFDKVVFGPGEATLSALAKGSVNDSYYQHDNDKIRFIPDFSFARINDYLSPQATLPLTASRGCYWRRCMFCPEAASPVHPYCSFSSEQLITTMYELAHQHHVSYIQLTDNAIPANMLRALAENKNQLEGINWFGFVRFEKVLEDASLVDKLAQSGCRMLQLGLESGSQQVLDRLGKGTTLASIERILENLARAKIATFVYIMLGTPGETEADAELTLNFLEKHANKIGFLNLAIMNMPRSSGLLDNPDVYGISSTEAITEDNPLGLYQRFHTDNNWTRASARRFLNKRLLGSAKIRAITKRTPPLFTSNHAVFFAEDVVAQHT